MRVLRYGSQVCAHGVCTQGYVLRCVRKGLRGFANKRVLLVCKQNHWSETSCGGAQGLCLDQGAVTSWRPCWSRLTVKVILQAGCRALRRWRPGGAQVGAGPSGGRWEAEEPAGLSREHQSRAQARGPRAGRGTQAVLPGGGAHRVLPLLLGQTPCLQSAAVTQTPPSPRSVQ